MKRIFFNDSMPLQAFAKSTTICALTWALLLGQPLAQVANDTNTISLQPSASTSSVDPNSLGLDALRDLDTLSADGASRTTGSSENEGNVQNAALEISPLQTEAAKHPFVRLAGQNLGFPIEQFGHSFFSDTKTALRLAKPAYQAAPYNYTLGPGDKIKIRVFGQISLNLEATVDQNGNITLPMVGSLQVAGVKLSQAGLFIKAALARYYRGFDVAVTLDALRSVQVYVTGFAKSPGSHRIDGLSTLINTLFATGGPNQFGSLRAIELRRQGRTVARLDLYKFLIYGDKSQDTFIQHEDVIYLPPIGSLAAIGGSVNAPYAFELHSGETLQDLLGFAGGIDGTAHTGLISVGRLDETAKRSQIELQSREASTQNFVLQTGDIVRVFGKQDFRIPRTQSGRYVKIEGEVGRAGVYPVLEGESFHDLIRKAGGLTNEAYLFGTEFIRDSVKEQQYKAFKETLDKLEQDLQRQLYSETRNTTDDNNNQSLRTQVYAAQEIMKKLRKVEPKGRLLLQVSPQTQRVDDLPALSLENNDFIYIPPRPSSIEVVGAVVRPSSYAYNPKQSVSNYIEASGGGVALSDTNNIYIARADGSVLANNPYSTTLLPGDAIIVPENLTHKTWARSLSEWSKIFYQSILGIGGWIILKNSF